MPGVTPPSYTITLAALLNLMVAGSKPSLIGQKVRGRYLVESRIGGGTFGTVYKVVDLESSRWVDGHVRRALKVIDVADPNQPRIPPPDYVNQRLRHAAREAYYHQLVSSHPNIVTLHEYFLIADRAEMFLVLDYFPGGDLLTYIDEGRNPFGGDDRRMREIILQICDALDFVHSKGVFHKDLKPQNILVSRDGRKVFLCDFGLSSDTQTNTRGGGTKAYMSPELLDRRGFYCPQRADTWTLGILILNMLGVWPWDEATIISRDFLKFMLVDDHLRRARPISLEANNLIRDILRFHPELRLSVPEISARVLQLRSFFDDPWITSTAAELQEMEYTYRSMLVKSDPIARRRKRLESLRSLHGSSAFNDLSGRLLHPRPPPSIHVPNSPDNPPPRPPRTYRPYCAPVLDAPPQVTTCTPEKPVKRRSKWWRLDNVKLTSGWYYP